MSTHPPRATNARAAGFMTVSQAASLLSVHRSTIRRWIEQGKLPAYRVGDKGVRIKEADVLDFATPIGSNNMKTEQEDMAEVTSADSLTEEDQRRGLEAACNLKRLRAEFEANYGKATIESWELLEESRDQRTRDLMNASQS